MPLSLDDEVLPITPSDAGTPFIFEPGAVAGSLFTSAVYPTQGNGFQVGHSGELRGLYGKPGSLLWKPSWSAYRADRGGGKIHWGVDIYAPVGTALVAVVDGELSFAQQANGLGLYAKLAFEVSGAPYVFHYGHMQSKHGAPRTARKGDIVGYVGCSGNSDNDHTCSSNMPGSSFSSSHVHFALLPPQSLGNPKRANPLTVLGWRLVTPPAPTGISFSEV